MHWEVYIIKTKLGRLYTGISTDSQRRLNEHQNNPKKGAKFFRSDPAQEIVWKEIHTTRSMALKREYQIKQMKRQEKEQLILSSDN